MIWIMNQITIVRHTRFVNKIILVKGDSVQKVFERKKISVVYKILKALERAMDYDEFDTAAISPERLGISRQRWEKLLIMLAKSEYIEGIAFDQCASDYSPRIEESIAPTITLRGLEYLEENSLMKKAAEIARGITENIK